ncbi:hypothetical protein [Sphingomonas sp. BAUL-RG-20F-R05-02]|uniref:hypothetical protein n=1 Tax=Sphingomonas sp. BAUL-RG-20F-R05-02 TaxID=2914830 RepID=UPI001F583D2E|nr:hypothetical protein [Sphingomonas sp. BAUL-RG-20F-R05-02]
MPNKELIDRLRFLEAYECEKAIAAQDRQQREMHFMKAAVHAACMVHVTQQTEGAIAKLIEIDGRPIGA